MPIPSKHSALKLAAIDLDGTLLGPDAQISPENLRAVEALHARQIEVVIATGRHYASTSPFLHHLPSVHWLITAQGGEVSSRDRSVLLGRHYLDPRQVETVARQAALSGFSFLVYATEGIFSTQTENTDIAYYARLSGVNPARIADRALSSLSVFKVLWLGDPGLIEAVSTDPNIAPDLVKVRTHHRIIEFLPGTSSKASGLETLAAHLKISPHEVVTFGDAENDISMFKWSGLSVAMAHGWPAALTAASQVSPVGPPESALARAIELVLGRQ